jgi:hypothetical protein
MNMEDFPPELKQKIKKEQNKIWRREKLKELNNIVVELSVGPSLSFITTKF